MNSQERSRLIRLAADDELSPEERAAFQAHLPAHPDDNAAVRFERDLREAVGRTMLERSEQSARASSELEVRIRDSLVQGAETVGASLANLQSGRWLLPRDPSAQRGDRRRRRILVMPSGLAAGIICLIAAAVVISLLIKQKPPPPGPQPIDTFNGMTWYMADEYAAWDNDPQHRSDRLQYRSIRELRDQVVQQSGWAGIRIPDLSAAGGFRFAGAAADPMLNSPAFHLRYADESSESNATVSVFIQSMPNVESELGRHLEPGKPYVLRSTSGQPQAANRCYTWIAEGGSAAGGGVVFHLVTRDMELGLRLALLCGMPEGDPIPLPPR